VKLARSTNNSPIYWIDRIRCNLSSVRLYTVYRLCMHMHDFERERFSRALRISESYMVRTASSRKRSCNIGGMVGNVLNHQLQSAFERRVCPSSQLATLAWMSADSLLWILPRILAPLSQEDRSFPHSVHGTSPCTRDATFNTRAFHTITSEP